VQTIVDLLEAKGISWAEYEQDMPSSGYTGNYNNPKTGANDYVRKHKYVSGIQEVERSRAWLT
jgi:acid phosphatase